jgi:hypothetical protein
MQFVSKQQTYEATRKLLINWAARYNDSSLEELARNMQMEGDRSVVPELYQKFLDTLKSDPLEPQDALDAAAQFLEQNVPADGNAEVTRGIHAARATAERPEDDAAFWNEWIALLESV